MPTWVNVEKMRADREELLELRAKVKALRERVQELERENDRMASGTTTMADKMKQMVSDFWGIQWGGDSDE